MELCGRFHGLRRKGVEEHMKSYKDDSKNDMEKSGEASHLAMEGSGWEDGKTHLEHMQQNQSLGKFEC